MVNSDPLDQLFHALTDATRRDMLRRLSQSDATVGQLADAYAMSLPAVSKHLKVLERAALVSRTRIGRRHWLRLEPGRFTEIERWMHALASAPAPHQLDRLAALVTGENEQHKPTDAALGSRFEPEELVDE